MDEVRDRDSGRDRDDERPGSKPPTNVNEMFTLKVDNVSYRAGIEDVRRMFDRYGEVGDVYIPRDRYTMESRGFAFVRFLVERDAETARDALDGSDFEGRQLRVQFAKQRRPENPKEFYSQRDRERRQRPRGGSYGGGRRYSPSRRSPPRRRGRSPSRSGSRGRWNPGNSRSRSPSNRRDRSRSGDRKRGGRRSRSPVPRHGRNDSPPRY